MRIARLLLCLLCLAALPGNQTNAQSQVHADKTLPAPGQPAQEAGRLNEFVLDGTESCVEIKKGNAAIRPELSAITNAANFSNRIAPGGIAVAWGLRFSGPGEDYAAANTPLKRQLGRVQVLWRAADWDGAVGDRCGWRAAPLYYVGANQINFQVPMFFYKPFAGDENTSGYGRFANFEGRDYEFIILAVLQDGVTKVSSNTFKLKVNSHAPEYFGDSLFDYPAWRRPAEMTAGQTYIAFLTGLGKISDHEPEGYATPPSPWTTSYPTVIEFRTIFNGRLLRANYLFAGRVPGLVGVDQINFTVPYLPLNSGEPVVVHICTGSDNADRCGERGLRFVYRTP